MSISIFNMNNPENQISSITAKRKREKLSRVITPFILMSSNSKPMLMFIFDATGANDVMWSLSQSVSMYTKSNPSTSNVHYLRL